MGLFGRRTRADSRESADAAPERSLLDADLDQLAVALGRIEDAGHDDRAKRAAVHALTETAAPEDAGPDRPWSWLADVTGQALTAGRPGVAVRAVSFALWWQHTWLPRLGPDDLVLLTLSPCPDEALARICVAGLVALQEYPDGAVVMDDGTDTVSAGVLRAAVAEQLLGMDASLLGPQDRARARASTDGRACRDDVLDHAFLEPARATMIAVRNCLSEELGMACVALDESPFGVGVLVRCDAGEYAIVGMTGGDAGDLLTITAGVARQLTVGRATVLAACNERTRNDARYPVFLHEAATGSSVLVQQAHPAPLMLTNPHYLGHCVHAVARTGRAERESMADEGIVGLPYTEHRDDVHELFMRSML